MTGCSLRAAELGDLDALTRLVAELNAEDGIQAGPRGSIEAAVQQLLSDAGLGLVVVAEADGVPGGLCGYGLVAFGFDLEFGGREAFVNDLYVCPDQRGRGVGRALLRNLEARAVAAGARAVHLAVRPANAAARSLYAAEGYLDTGRLLLSKRMP